jgi:hypothetical protein
MFSKKEFQMSALTSYVDRKNAFSKLFGSKLLSLQNAEDRKRIAQSIDSELSPEHLTCDGELSRSQVQARYKSLTSAATELARLDPVAAREIYELYTGE